HPVALDWREARNAADQAFAIGEAKRRPQLRAPHGRSRQKTLDIDAVRNSQATGVVRVLVGDQRIEDGPARRNDAIEARVRAAQDGADAAAFLEAEVAAVRYPA